MHPLAAVTFGTMIHSLLASLLLSFDTVHSILHYTNNLHRATAIAAAEVGLAPGVISTVPPPLFPSAAPSTEGDTEAEAPGVAVAPTDMEEIWSTTLSLTTCVPLTAPAMIPARMRMTKIDKQIVHCHISFCLLSDTHHHLNFGRPTLAFWNHIRRLVLEAVDLNR
jgi:hypothetical protein